jgi:hypothetical protein
MEPEKEKKHNISNKQSEIMQKQFQDRPFQSLEEAVSAVPPPPPVMHKSKKLSLLQGHYLAQIYSPVLLFLLIFIIVACIHYYRQDLTNQFLVPFAHSSNSRIAICLVGGARRFELTGPTILKNVLNVFPEADLFVHSNLDKNSFKLGLFRLAPRVTEVRIRRPMVFPETDEQRKLLSAGSSPNGIQVSNLLKILQQNW